MKKILTILVTITMLGVITISTYGSLGVNVPPGCVLEFDNVLTENDNFFSPSVIIGINDKLALGVMYDTSYDFYTVSSRYVILRNFSFNGYYRFYGTGSWKVDLRGKYLLNQKVALAGMVSYDSLAIDGLGVLGQAEYFFSEHLISNVGLNQANSTTYLVIGTDYTTGNYAVGFSYIVPTNDYDSPIIEVVLDYLIKYRDK